MPDQGPGFEVVDPDFRSRGHEDAVAVAGVRVLGVGVVRVGHRRGRGSRLDEDVLDGGIERAGGRDLVVREERDPGRDAVFGHVRVGPLVYVAPRDVVRNPVPPVLQELGRRPGVIHLIEVHLLRLAQAVDPHGQDDYRECHDHPDVQLVEATSRLRIDRGGPVGMSRRASQPVPQPHDPRRHVERPVGLFEVAGLVDPPCLFLRVIEVVHAARRVARALGGERRRCHQTGRGGRRSARQRGRRGGRGGIQRRLAVPTVAGGLRRIQRNGRPQDRRLRLERGPIHLAVERRNRSRAELEQGPGHRQARAGAADPDRPDDPALPLGI